MSLLDRISNEAKGETRADRPTDSLGELYRRREQPLLTGELVDEGSAGRHSAVFACVDLITRLVSTLPVHEHDRAGGALRQLPTPPVLMSPDGELDISGWLAQVLESLLLRGNAFGLIQRYDARGWPAQIATVNPDVVSYQRRGRNGPIEWKLEGEPIEKWPAGDLWHMPGYLVAGCPIGFSPIGKAAVTIGVGLGVQRFAAQWFRDGMVPAGLLTNEDEVPKDVRTLVKELWRDTLMGNREPVVLGDGWKYEQISVAPEESQFLDTIQANDAQVSRFFGVNVEDIGGVRPGGSSVLYQNQEHTEIHLLVRTINPWLVRLERALTALRPRPRFVKINPDALLRVDAQTRAKVFDMGIRGGWKSPDEVRALDDEAPIPDGKGGRYLWPPGRMQLDEHEVKLGADSDPAIEPLPQPEAAAGGERSPNQDVLELTQALQRIYLAVANEVITSEEARMIVNRMGADLPEQMPEPDPQPAAVGTNGQSGDT